MSWEYTGETSWKPREKGVNGHDFNCIFGSLASGPSAFFRPFNTSRYWMETVAKELRRIEL